MTSKALARFVSWMPVVGVLALCVGLLGLPEGARAKEFLFEAHELGKGKGPFEMGETEIWLPTAVVIDQKEDLSEPIWFVIKNPTGIDHEFAVGGSSCFCLKKRRSPRQSWILAPPGHSPETSQCRFTSR